MLDNSSICDDQVFAQLTDMFGDSVSTEVILRTGSENKWILDKCVDKLVKFDSSRSLQTIQSRSRASNDEDADMLVESEEMQRPMPSENIEMQSPLNQEPENRPQWPRNMSFASCLHNNVGFSATNPGFNRNGSPHAKQPSLASNPIEKHPDVPEIIREIEKNHRIMIVMRGAPGSGKTHLAQSLIDKTMNGDYANHIFSTDDFFLDTRTKRYIYDRSKLSQAHDNNQFRVSQRAMNGWSPIIVDNTHMKLWEMFPYLREGVRNDYILKILEPNTPWRIAVRKLAQKNKHGVDQESISRMLQRYEPVHLHRHSKIIIRFPKECVFVHTVKLQLNSELQTIQQPNCISCNWVIGNGTIRDVLRSMQIHNYKMEGFTPKLRCFPEIVSTSSKPNEKDLPSTSRQINDSATNGIESRHTSKSQRSRKHGHDREQADNNDTDFGQTFNAVIEKIGNNHKQWPAFEEEQGSFWNSESIAKPTPDQNLPKPQRQPSGNSDIPNLYHLLQDSNKKEAIKERDEIIELKKHKKNCENENKSFQEIRQIYPTIPVALLWDLFEKCYGDGNWTMDILLNESETKELQKLNTQDEIDRDDFTCYCDIPAELKLIYLKQVAGAIPNEWLKDSRTQALPQRNPRRAKNAANESEIRKQIEEQFVISDKRYSEHTRKIRDLRRGVSSTVASNDVSDRDDLPSDETVNEHDEMIEMNLGIELVCQLDQVFGSSTFQSDTLKEVQTKVFMPRTLGQQLYAIWIESLYNQIEEQRQQSIKDDEEFAKELQVKQTGNSTSIFEVASSKPNIRNIAEMEYTWKAYSTNPNEWKQTTPEDLATKLTKAKLFEIFPNVERQQLIEVFSSYGNQFSKTVDFFKESLKSDIDDKMQSSGQELVNQARIEAQAIRPPMATSSKPILHRIKQNRTLDKLDMEDAKRAALKEFEESRNMAMHHSHLKAECYNKAREAFQRKQAGVAYYYTNVASLHHSKIEHFNHKAANAIVEVHSYTQQNPDMLDLHYLHAGEAIECLDVYLDQHIKELKDAIRGFKHVFIITGRGLHSTGGFSTIKHRVKCRLKERRLTWAEVNPGLLKVKLQYISLFVHDINKQS